VASLKVANVASDVESVAIQLGKKMDELKHEHRIEVKLMKKEYASVKTKAKLLVKEEDELVDAYEMERAFNNKLETSLEEMVNLFQAKRAVHGDKAKEFKINKKKFGSMQKKCTPIDCAYMASRILLERLEDKLLQVLEGKDELSLDRSINNDGYEEVNSAIKLIDGLSSVFWMNEPGLKQHWLPYRKLSPATCTDG